MADDITNISIELDDESVRRKLGQDNQGIAELEGKGKQAGAALSAGFKQAGEAAEQTIRIIDRSRASVDRLVASYEKRNAAIGRTPEEQRSSARDFAVNRAAGDPKLIERINFSYQETEKRIRALDAAAAQAKGLAEYDRMLRSAQKSSQDAARDADQFQRALQRVNQTAAESQRQQNTAISGLQRKTDMSLASSPVQRLELQRSAFIQDNNITDPAKIRAVTTEYQRLIEAQKAADARASQTQALAERERMLNAAVAASRRAEGASRDFGRALQQVNDRNAESARKAAEATRKQEEAIVSVERRAQLANARSKDKPGLQAQFMAADQGITDPEKIKRIESAYQQLADGQEKHANSFIGSTARIARQAFITIAALEGFRRAFDSLLVEPAEYAARTQTLGVVLDAVAKANNLSTQAVRSQSRAVAELGITTQESRQSVTKMIFAQLDLSKATQLARVSQDAAVIAGVNSSQAFENIILGITTGQTRLLHTMGLQVSLEQTIQEEERKRGRALTEVEKRQAMLNKVLEEGAKIQGTYEAAMGTTGKQMTSLSRYADEAKNAFGEQFEPALGVVVRGLTELFKWAQENAGALGDLTKGVIAAGAAFGTFWAGSKIEQLIVAFPQMLSSVNGFSVGIGSLGGFAAILGVAAFAAAYNQMDQLEEKYKDFFGSTLEEAQRYVAGVQTVLDDVRKGKTSPNFGSVINQVFEEQIRLQSAGGVRKRIQYPGEEDQFGRPNWANEDFIDWVKKTTGLEPDRVRAIAEHGGQLGRRVQEALAEGFANAAPFRMPTGLSIELPKPPNPDEPELKRLEDFARKVGGERGLQMLSETAGKRLEYAKKQGDLSDFVKQAGVVDSIARRQEQLKLVQQETEKLITLEKKESEFGVSESRKLEIEREATLRRLMEISDIKQRDSLMSRTAAAYDLMIHKAATAELEKELELRKKLDDIVQQQESAFSRPWAVDQAMNQQISDIELDAESRKLEGKSRRELVERQAKASQRIIELRSTDKSSGIMQGLAVRQAELRSLRQLELEQVDFEAGLDGGKIERLRIEREFRKQMLDAQMDAELRLAELQNNRFESLKRSAEGIFDALLTRSGSVLSAIGNTIKAAILTPLKEAASTWIAAMLMPMYGGSRAPQASGSGGIFSNLLSGFGGGGGGGVSFGGGSQQTGGGSILQQLSGLLGAPGGTSGFAGPLGGSSSRGLLGLAAALPMFGASNPTTLTSLSNASMSNTLAGLWGSSSITGGAAAGSAKGIAGLLAGLSSFGFNSGSISLGSGMATTALGPGGIGGLQGVLAGAATSPAALIGGGLLAYLGLKRGGLLGAGMTIGGGALAGAAAGTLLFPGIGTAVGAAIGTAAGGIASIFRSLFKSSTEKIHDRIKSVYGVDITSKGILEQIAGIVKSSYGGDIEVGIASTQIRDLVELYAMSTGQKIGASAQARNVNLVQRGGTVYQAPTYINGEAYGFTSSLPSLTGSGLGVLPITTNTTSSPTYIQLEPGQANDLLAGKVVQIIGNSPAAVSSASAQAARSGLNAKGTYGVGAEPMTVFA